MASVKKKTPALSGRPTGGLHSQAPLRLEIYNTTLRDVA